MTLEYNIKVHDRIAKKYEKIHGEIYNTVEQERLKSALALALSYIKTGNKPLRVIDFGCGAGNLTRHLTEMGCEVLAADVSVGFLDLVSSREYPMPVETVKLNGTNLSNIPNESVDMVAMYSVLHHIPDYLAIMSEFSRVTKKGGVIFIDHEAADSIWDKSEAYDRFLLEIRKTATVDLMKFFTFTNYIDRIIRTFINPKYQREGDIHVFQNDHIEWDKIRVELGLAGISNILEDDYLLFKRSYNRNTYEEYKQKVSDMHLLIGIKG